MQGQDCSVQLDLAMPIARLRLDHPDRGNALGPAMQEALEAALDDAMAAGALLPSGCPGFAVAATRVVTTGSASAKTPAASSALVSAMEISTPSIPARAAMNALSPIK